MSGLAEDLAAHLDPVVLARRLEMQPDPWQARVLRSSAQRLLMLTSRQSGKSTVGALMATHTAVYDPGALVLMLSPSQRQSQELFRKAMGFYRAMGRPVAPKSENELSLTLESGSRIVSLPGGEGTIRGFSAVRLLLVDEAARVEDATYYAARPMVAVSEGRIVLMSTPAGKRGFFYDHVQNPEPEGWAVERVPAAECPRLSPAFLAAERRTLGEYHYTQEYELAFVDDVMAVFAERWVSAAFSREIEPLWRTD